MTRRPNQRGVEQKRSLSAYVPWYIYDAIEERARETGTTVSDCTREALEWYVTKVLRRGGDKS